MEYQALVIGLADELYANLKSLIQQCSLRFTTSFTVQEASRLLSREIFHLLIADLDYLKDIQQADWLAGIR